MKNPLTPAGIEPATFRFVAQHLNHCATAVALMDNNTDETPVRTVWGSCAEIPLFEARQI